MFDIAKPTSTGRILIDKKFDMTCVGVIESTRCTVRGSGHRFEIAGAEAEVSFDGFAFRGASKCVLWVLSTDLKNTGRKKLCDFVE